MRNIHLSPEALETLIRGHFWPGNIRELENVIHHAILVRQGNIIRPADLNLSSLRSRVNAPIQPPAPPIHPVESLKNALINLFEEGGGHLYETIEGYVIRTAYEYCHHNQLETARLLGISRNIVRARLLQCGELGGKRRIRSQEPGGTGLTSKELGKSFSHLADGALAEWEGSLKLAGSLLFVLSRFFRQHKTRLYPVSGIVSNGSWA